MQNDLFGRGLYAAQAGDPGVSEGRFPDVPCAPHSEGSPGRGCRADRAVGPGGEPVAVDEAPGGGLCPERERGADQVEVKSGEVYGNRSRGLRRRPCGFVRGEAAL